MTWVAADGTRYDGMGLQPAAGQLAACYWGPVAG
jgi:hypothetical protein